MIEGITSIIVFMLSTTGVKLLIAFMEENTQAIQLTSNRNKELADHMLKAGRQIKENVSIK